MTKILTPEQWLRDNSGLFPTKHLAMEGYARYILSEHRKAAKYYFEGRIFTEEDLIKFGNGIGNKVMSHQGTVSAYLNSNHIAGLVEKRIEQLKEGKV